MKRLSYLLILLPLVLGWPNDSVAQPNFNGGKGLTYVNSAWTLDNGFLTLTGFVRSFGTVSNPPGQNSFTVWDVSGRASLNLGLGRHIEVIVAPQIYQDTNRSANDVNIPGDLHIGLKIGSFSSPGSPLAYGFTVNGRFPTAETDNLPFEPYSAGKFSWGLGGLLTYSMDPLYPDEGTSVHANFGYWNHNDVGAELIPGNPAGTAPRTMSQELFYGAGVNIPKDVFNFSLEIYGNYFIQSPPTTAYSRENYLYLTPRVAYSPTRWFGLNLSVDLRLINTTNSTDFGRVPSTIPGGQPNYPGWRLGFGTKFTLLPTSVYKTDERDILMQKAETRRELFEQIIKEQRETEAAETELERIKAERLRAEKELERLRRILEGQASEDKTQQNNGTEKKKKDNGEDNDKDN